MTIVISDGPTSKTIGHTDYERYRRRQIAYGRWDRWTDPEPIREHILALRRHGMGRDSIARAAGVTEHTLRRIVNRNTNKVHTNTARLILAIVDPKPPYADATGARRRLQALGTLGWDQCTLAARIGWDVRNLNLIVSGRRPQIAHDTNDRIHHLYEELSGTPAPAGYAASRAKSAAGRNGWIPPLGWEDVDIDDPTAAPYSADADDDGGDSHDETTVGFAIDGRLTYEQIRHHRPDLIEAIRRLATRMSDHEIALHLRWDNGHSGVCQIRNRNNIPNHHAREVVAPMRTRDRVRAQRRHTQAA